MSTANEDECVSTKKKRRTIILSQYGKQQISAISLCWMSKKW